MLAALVIASAVESLPATSRIRMIETISRIDILRPLSSAWTRSLSRQSPGLSWNSPILRKMNCCSSVILQVIATCVSSSLLGLLSAITASEHSLNQSMSSSSTPSWLAMTWIGTFAAKSA